MYPKRAILVLG